MPINEENERVILIDNLKNIIPEDELKLLKVIIKNSNPTEALNKLLEDKK